MKNIHLYSSIALIAKCNPFMKNCLPLKNCSLPPIIGPLTSAGDLASPPVPEPLPPVVETDVPFNDRAQLSLLSPPTPTTSTSTSLAERLFCVKSSLDWTPPLARLRPTSAPPPLPSPIPVCVVGGEAGGVDVPKRNDEATMRAPVVALDEPPLLLPFRPCRSCAVISASSVILAHFWRLCGDGDAETEEWVWWRFWPARMATTDEVDDEDEDEGEEAGDGDDVGDSRRDEADVGCDVVVVLLRSLGFWAN